MTPRLKSDSNSDGSLDQTKGTCRLRRGTESLPGRLKSYLNVFAPETVPEAVWPDTAALYAIRLATMFVSIEAANFFCVSVITPAPQGFLSLMTSPPSG